MSQQLHGSLTPAYGRDYSSGEDALKAWNDGKDFKINNPMLPGVLCSIRDTEGYPVGHQLQLRWNRMQDVAIITKHNDGTYTGNFEE